MSPLESWEIEGVDLPVPFTDPRIPLPVPGAAKAPVPPFRMGELTVFFSCRGGVGSTTLTTNLANLLARAGKSVCLVDLDLQLGDVLVTLGLENRNTLATVVREMDLYDDEDLRGRLAQHASGFHVLSQVGALHELTPDFLARLPIFLSRLRQKFDVVLVDGLRDFSDPVLAALDNASQVVLVVTQDVCSVRRGGRVMSLFRELNTAEGRVAALVNRSQRRTAIQDTDLVDALRIPVLAHVRNDFRSAQRGQDWAQLVTDAPSGLTDDLREAASAIWPRVFPARPRRGAFGFLRRRGA